MRKVRNKKAAREKRRKIIVEPLEPRTLFSADVVSASLALDPIEDNSLDQHNWLANNAQSDFAVSNDKGEAYPKQNREVYDDKANRVLNDGENQNNLIGFEEQISDVIAELQPDFEQSRQLIIIDSRVDDSDALLQDVIDNGQPDTEYEIILLRQDSDGIEQITSALNTHGEQKYDAVHIIAHGSDAELQLGSTQLNSGNLQHYKNELLSWRSELAHDADILLYGCDVAQTAKGQGLSLIHI